MDLEEPKYKDCGECKYFEDKGKGNYDCKYLRQKKTYFCSDGSDTAEECKYYEYQEVTGNSSHK